MDINKYNEIEQLNREKLSNKMIEAFSPYHFVKSGYPITIFNINEINRYHDIMHENRFEINLKFCPQKVFGFPT